MNFVVFSSPTTLYMLKTNKDVLVVFWVIKLKGHCFYKQRNK